MRVLGLDTTGRQGSVALVCDGAVVDTFTGDAARPHAQRLPGDMLTVLERNRLAASDIDVFAVAAGPGSFTGLRIGIAAVQGLAYATGRPVVGVSALEALADGTRELPGVHLAGRVGVWMDAQRDEVFAAVYARDVVSGAWELADGPLVDAPARVVERWRAQAAGAPLFLVGDGAVRYRALLIDAYGADVAVLDPPPLAPSVALLGWQRACAGEAGLPHAVRPLYVRRPDAELARDRAAARTS